MDLSKNRFFAAVLALALGFWPAAAYADNPEQPQEETASNSSGNSGSESSGKIVTNEAALVNGAGAVMNWAGGFLPPSYGGNALQGWGTGAQDIASNMWGTANSDDNMISDPSDPTGQRKIYDQSKINADYPGMTVSPLDTTTLNLTGNGLSPYNFSPHVRDAISRGGRIVTDAEGNIVTVAIPGQSLMLSDADVAGLTAAMEGAKVKEGENFTTPGPNPLTGTIVAGGLSVPGEGIYPIDEFGNRQDGPPSPFGSENVKPPQTEYAGGTNAFDAYAGIGDPSSVDGILGPDGTVDEEKADENTLLVQGCAGETCGDEQGSTVAAAPNDKASNSDGVAGGVFKIDPTTNQGAETLASIRETNKALHENAGLNTPFDEKLSFANVQAYAKNLLAWVGGLGGSEAGAGLAEWHREATASAADPGQAGDFTATDGTMLLTVADGQRRGLATVGVRTSGKSGHAFFGTPVQVSDGSSRYECTSGDAC